MQGLKEIDLQMSNYMQILEIAVQHGLPVLLKNVHETLDAALDPILTKSVMKIGQYYAIDVNTVKHKIFASI